MPCQQWLLIFLIAGTTTLIAGAPDRTKEESMSLTGALNAITRKQRALDSASQDFYDLRNMKYPGADIDRNRKIGKEQQAEREMARVDEQIEFLPNDVSQLETVGNDLRTTDLNDKTRKKVLVDYLNGVLQQEEPVTSLFRERERGVNRKRTGGSDRINIDNKQLAKLFLEEEDESPYNIEQEDGKRDGDEPGRMKTDVLQALYNRYWANLENRKHERRPGAMPWSDSANQEFLMQDQDAEGDDSEFTEGDVDPKLLYLLLADRKTLDRGRPLRNDYRMYRIMDKRYPVAKRSPQPPKKQATDPKVVQDLGALFGKQSSTNHNHTYDHDHGHGHDHDHDHDHGHGHDHDHDHDHDHKQQKHESSTEASKVNLPMKDQKDNATKNDKSKPIEVRKKSIDWSQYFGIDRRRKKSLFVPGQGTQNQDDEWMLQRYYENMGNNLRGNDRESKKENFRRDQMKKTLACILEKYPLEKMEGKANQTSNFRENRLFSKLNDKSKRDNDDDDVIVEDEDDVVLEDDDDPMVGGNNGNGYNEGIDDGEATCLLAQDVPEIQERCKFILAPLAGSDLQWLFHAPCVMLETCRTCVKGELKKKCLISYFADTKRICNSRPGKRPNMLCPAIAISFALF